MAYFIGTKSQVRAAIGELTIARAIPRDGALASSGARVAGALTARYSVAVALSDGRWCCVARDDDAALLSAPLASLVQLIEPTRDVDGSPLVDGASIVSSTRWMRPWIVRAEIVELPQDIPIDESTVEHLWDTSEPDSVGTRYVRADGEREFVLQQIANETDHVFVLWFGGDAADPNETLYSQAMIAAATALGVVLESVECTYGDGAWIVGEIAEGSTIASRWPSTWRVFQPGDGATPTGARCIREVALVS